MRNYLFSPLSRSTSLRVSGKRIFLLTLRAALFFVILAGMTSCLGVNAEIVLNADSTGTLSLEYRISRILDSLGKLDGNEGRPPLPVGRIDLERTLDRIPGMKLLSFASKEDLKDRIITAKLQFNDIDSLLTFLDAAGEKAVFQGGEQKKLIVTLNQGAQRQSPEMEALIAQITQGYRVALSMSVPSNAAAALLDGEGSPLKPESMNSVSLVSRGKKASCSLPLETVLSAEKGIRVEFSW